MFLSVKVVYQHVALTKFFFLVRRWYASYAYICIRLMCLVLNYPRRIAVHCCVVLLFDLSKLFACALIFFYSASTLFVYSFVYGCVIFRSHLGYLYAFSSWYTQFSAFVLTEKKNTLTEYTWKTCDSWKCGNVAMWAQQKQQHEKSGLQIV